MVDVTELRSVPVGELRRGLYVAEPDRPWTEVPLMFQGFEIASDEELAVLREHCEHVYIDVDRSTAPALEALDAGAESPPSEPDVPAGRAETDTAGAFGRERRPDAGHFAQLLRRAWESRSQTRHFVEAVFDGLERGRTPGAAEGRAAVADLLQTVADNPGAAVWLSNLAERDASTSVHSLNVCILALTFGSHLGLEREELESIGLGALLHDIGKLSMPAEMRDKPGTLTDSEWEVAKRHPKDGHDVLVEKGGYPRAVLDIVRLHHERLDGNGYPEGRTGVELPLHARVVALANTYDSWTSERPYRPAMPADEALQRLYNGAEASFGARLVQEFIRCVGIYPPGSLVELDNGAAGVVLGSRPDARIQPTVLLVRSPDGEFYRKRVVLNLAADADGPGPASARHIRRALNPADEDIDVAGIVAIEFGLDLSG